MTRNRFNGKSIKTPLKNKCIPKSLTPRKEWTFVLEALCEIEKSRCMLTLGPKKNSLNYD